MDVFSSINSGLSHGLVAEFTVYGEEGGYLEAAAFAWLTEGFRASVAIEGEGDPPSDLLSAAGFRPRGKGASPGGGGALWGRLTVSPAGTFEVLSKPYSQKFLPWLERCIDGRPESVIAEIGEFSERGEVGNSDLRFSVSFDEELPSYVKLRYHVDDAMLTGPETARVEHARLLAASNWVCSKYDVVFGHLSYDHAGGATELERYLRGPARVPTLNTPRWRECLRGYSWLMTIPGEVVRALGGVNVLRDSGAFWVISPLPNGSIMLQATPTFNEYQGEAVKSVLRAVRDVLITGEFRPPAPAPGQPPTHMVIFGE
ncbi:hypothetical protein [Streptomyces purpureus]|uniref:Uncharacterized protein n=1 Tax=Streptomyces purpureus TaxID=1951 RepID=A0A918LW63_9ACTN|nr:hypothetical protein [Streptomyces purpureus]GGT61036.1 hypothetical protein GCM10014713_62950 [Streptomyces purpureus]